MEANRLISLAVTLTVANFIYQLATQQQWLVATERSYFQAGALFIAWLNMRWLNPLP